MVHYALDGDAVRITAVVPNAPQIIRPCATKRHVVVVIIVAVVIVPGVVAFESAKIQSRHVQLTLTLKREFRVNVVMERLVLILISVMIILAIPQQKQLRVQQQAAQLRLPQAVQLQVQSLPLPQAVQSLLPQAVQSLPRPQAAQSLLLQSHLARAPGC